MDSKNTLEGNQPRISFKIGGRKADTKPDSCKSEGIRNSSMESSNHTSNNISGGLSQASTLSAGQLPASQDDIFATQSGESSFAAESSPPLQSSGSTSGPADYDDFLIASNSLDKNGTGPPNSNNPVSPKTSTPRKRKTHTIICGSTSTSKLTRITEETSSHSDTKSGKSNISLDRSEAEGQYDPSPRKNTCGGDSSVLNSKRLRWESDNYCTSSSPNNKQNRSETSLRSSDDDCEFVKSSDKETTKGIEVITIDAARQNPTSTKEESPEITMLHKKARQSLEVVYVSSPMLGVSTLSERSSLRNVPVVAESQEDSMCFQLSPDPPTQNMFSEPDILVRPVTEGKPITIEDDGDRACAVTYNQGSGHNVSAPLPHITTGGSSLTHQNTLSMDLEKLKKSCTDGDPCILPEINGIDRGNLKKTTYTVSFSVTVSLEYDSLSHKIHSSEIVHCEPTAEDPTHVSSRGLSDLSNGMLADVSDQSKPNSPSSVAGIGPFPLQPSVRASMVSTFSSSSTGTSSSGGSVGAGGLKAHGHSLYASVVSMTDRTFPVHNSDHMNSLQRSVVYNIKNIDKVVEAFQRASESHVSKVAGEDGLFVSPKLYVSRKDKTEAVALATKPQDFLPTVGSTPNNKSKNTVGLQHIPDAIKSQSAVSLGLSDENLANVTPSPSTGVGRSPKPSNVLKSGTKPRYNRNTKSRSKGSKSSTGDVPKEDEKSAKKSTPKNKGTPARAAPASRRRMLVQDDPVAQEDAVNLLVFARWLDKHYYSGKVVGQTKDGRFNILFDDGKAKCLMEEFVVIVPELRKGLLVFAIPDDEDSFRSGVIVSMKVADGVIMYVVELDQSNQCVTVPRSKLRMTEDQVKLLTEPDERRASSPGGCGVTPTSDTMYKVVPDNIIVGKRVRSLKVNRPGYSGQGRTNRNNSFGGKSLEGEEDLSSDDDSGVEKEEFPRMNPKCLKGSATNVKEQVYYIPPKSKIFEGMNFLFSCSALSGPVPASSSDSSGCATTMPFIKDALTTQLTMGGGVVLDSFDAIDDLSVPPGSVYLISNGPCLTATYILCLCTNIPILKHEWVIISSIQGKKLGLSKCYLQAGYSIEKQTYVEQHIGNTRRKRPLNNKNVVLISVRTSSTFAKFWTKVLECLGARVTPMASKPDKDIVDGVDIIVAAPSLMHDLRDWAQELGITIFSTEWMQQCVINWKECAVAPTPDSPTY